MGTFKLIKEYKKKYYFIVYYTKNIYNNTVLSGGLESATIGLAEEEGRPAEFFSVRLLLVHHVRQESQSDHDIEHHRDGTNPPCQTDVLFRVGFRVEVVVAIVHEEETDGEDEDGTDEYGKVGFGEEEEEEVYPCRLGERVGEVLPESGLTSIGFGVDDGEKDKGEEEEVLHEFVVEEEVLELTGQHPPCDTDLDGE